MDHSEIPGAAKAEGKGAGELEVVGVTQAGLFTPE
jgi:hypothetical protein